MPAKVIFLLPMFWLVPYIASAQKSKIDSLRRIISVGNDSVRVKSLNELSWYYKNIRIDSAVLLARQALAIATMANDQAGKGQSFNSLGSAKQAMGEYDSAIFYIHQAIQVKLTGADSSRLANELSNLGIIYDERGDYEKALRCYFPALRIARKNADLRMEANILSNIGVVYKKQKQYKKVIDYYQESLSIYRKLNSDFGVTVTSGNIGSVMLQTGEYEKSIEFSQRARKEKKKLGYVRYVPYTIGNMAIANDSLHRFPAAEEQYLEAFTRHMKFENRYEAAYNSKNLAAYYLRQHQPLRAKPYAARAIDLASAIGAKEMQRDAFLVLSSVFQSLGQFKEAYLYQLKYAALKDSLFEETRTRSIMEMQVKYEAEAKELEISNQKVQLATNELELQRQRNELTWLAAASVVLLIAGAFVFLQQRSGRRKAEQEAAFKLKLAELERKNELQQVRQRISRELHDNIGSRLLFLTSSADSLADKIDAGERERLHQIGEFARTTLHELRRTVWFINQDYVNLEELQVKMTEYFNFLGQSPSVGFHLSLNADPTIVVGTSVAAAVFRVAQEAVSNALKHSSASAIDIRLSSGEEWIELQVKDNGKGFDVAGAKNGEGNGLRNMSRNAEMANGTLAVNSGDGTLILMRIPLKP